MQGNTEKTRDNSEVGFGRSVATGMIATFVASGSVLIAGTGSVEAQEVCSRYTVVSGDTLSQIASRAGVEGGFLTLFDANRGTLRSPNVIEIGQQLVLPCADGSLPNRTSAVVEPQTAPAEVETDAPGEIRLVTASGYAPFTDEGMTEGGIYTQLVKAAMATMEPDVETSITFVNDWGSHLETLLPAVAFDGAFPWLVPDCSDSDTLTENSKFRCEEFLHSNPFYEIVNGLTVAADSPLATTEDYTDFHGLNICLPDGYTDASLAAGGLVEPTISLTRPTDPDDCVSLLAAGEVDAVSMQLRQVNDIISRLDLEGQFETNSDLTVTNTLAVFISKKNPDGPEMIEMLNQGLANIQDSGVWFTTVRDGFREFYEE